MGKYQITGLISASIIVGEYEADSKEEAISMAEQDRNANFHAGLCHQCAKEVDLGDVYELIADKIDD